MDPAAVALLTGVGANWLSDFADKVTRDAWNWAESMSPDHTIHRLVESAVDQTLADHDLLWLDNAKVVDFLASPEAAQAVSRLFVSRVAEVTVAHAQAEEFAQLAVLWTGEVLSHDEARQLFHGLLTLVDSLISKSIEEGTLAAHEARSTFRFNVLMQELSRTQQLFASLDKSAYNLPAILAFEQDLREHIATETALLMPPYLDSVKRVPIDALYVPPRLRHSQTSDYDDAALTVEDFVATSYRTVVLGNPGGGKSTLAQKICHDLANQAAGITPLMVTLREYGVRKRDAGASLKDFLYELAHSRYQLDPPTNAFEYLLGHGRLLIVLDGLDELVNTADRQRITADVEHFCTSYDGLPVIVTSRKVGYEQAPLNSNVFEQYELGEFTVEQAREYATKWFGADASLSSAERDTITESFMRECEQLPDLRSNALMLGLLCNIYRGENWIPRNRPEVYEKCALLLFERWDRRRGIIGFQTFESHLRPALEHIAHWIFCDATRQSDGVSESDLIDEATRYLLGRRFDDEVEATQAAREFIEFCRGRAWVFTDTGTAAGGEALYQFTHRTFLEYFAAVHLVRTHPTPSDLAPLLMPHIVKSEWEMVSQLAFHIQDRQVDRAGDTLIVRVLEETEGAAAARLAGVGFAARALNGLVPTPGTVRRVAREGTRLVVTAGAERIEAETQVSEAATVGSTGDLEVLGALLMSSTENWEPVEQGIGELLFEQLEDGKGPKARAAAEIGLNLTLALPHGQRVTGSDAVMPWRELAQTVISRCGTQLRELSDLDPGIASDLVWKETITIGEFLTATSTDELFRGRSFGCFPGFRRISIAEFLLLSAVFGLIFEADAPHDPATMSANLTSLGEALARKRVPWARRDSMAGWAFRLSGEQAVGPRLDDLTGGVFLGVFALIAVGVENMEVGGDRRLLRAGLDSLPTTASWQALRRAVDARMQKHGAHLDKALPLDERQRLLISAWAAGKIDVTS